MSLCTDADITLSQIKLKNYDSTSSDLINGVVDVYVEYTGFDAHSSRRFIETFTRQKDFVGLVALHDEQVVGMSFGVQSKVGNWWHDRVVRELNAYHAALQNAWVLTQLNVLSTYRGQQIGSLLHDAIIEQQPYPNLLLSTQKSNLQAQHFYQQHDWYVLHEGFSFTQGDEPYMIWAKTR